MQKDLNTSLQYEDVELSLKLEEVMNQVKGIMKNLVPMTEERKNYEDNTLVSALPGLILLLGVLCAIFKNFVFWSFIIEIIWNSGTSKPTPSHVDKKYLGMK